MKPLMYTGAILNAIATGVLVMMFDWENGIINFLIFVAVCVDQLCEALKERA